MWMNVARAGVLLAAPLWFLAGCSTSVGEGNRLESLSITTTGLLGTDTGKSYLCFRDRLIAVGTFTDGSRGDFSNRVTWTSSNPAAALVSNGDVKVPGSTDETPLFFQSGTLIPLHEGATTITASYIGLKASYDVEVETSSLSVTPAKLRVAPNTTQSFRAMASVGGYEIDATAAANWNFVYENATATDSDGDGINDKNADGTTLDKCPLSSPGATVITDTTSATYGCTDATKVDTSLATLTPSTGAVRGVTPSDTVLKVRPTFDACDVDNNDIEFNGTTYHVVIPPSFQPEVAQSTFKVETPVSLALSPEVGTSPTTLTLGITDQMGLIASFADDGDDATADTEDISGQALYTATTTAVPAGTPSTTAVIAPVSLLATPQHVGSATVVGCYDPRPQDNDGGTGDPTTPDTTGSCTDADTGALRSNSIAYDVVEATLDGFAIDQADPLVIKARGSAVLTATGEFTRKDDASHFSHPVTRLLTWTACDVVDPPSSVCTATVVNVVSTGLAAGVAISLQAEDGESKVTATNKATTPAATSTATNTTDDITLHVCKAGSTTAPCPPP